jgi:hypothetical protein
MRKYLEAGQPTSIVFPDTPAIRNLRASCKDGLVTLIDNHAVAVYYRNQGQIMKLPDVKIRRDKCGYYVEL